MLSFNQDGGNSLGIKMASAERCNEAHADLVALLDELNISDEAKDQIKNKSGIVARYAAISGMEASKHIAVQMLDQISNGHDDDMINSISRSAGRAIINSVQILIDSTSQQPKT